MDLSLIKSKVQQFLRIFIDYPAVDIILAVLILIYVLWTMRDRKSSAGAWGLLFLGIVLFMLGLSGITGMGLGMSF